jgi:hypothetical protein
MLIFAAKAILTFAAVDFLDDTPLSFIGDRCKPLYFQHYPDFPQSSHLRPQDVVVSDRLHSTP